jgi:hypothetical protein
MFLPNIEVLDAAEASTNRVSLRIGDYVAVRVDTASSAGTMRGTPLYRTRLATFSTRSSAVSASIPSSPLPSSFINNVLHSSMPQTTAAGLQQRL